MAPVLGRVTSLAPCGHGEQSSWAKRTSPHHPILRIGVWEPGDALFAHGAGHDLAIPIHQKLSFVKAGASAGLPTGVVSDGADERDPIHPLALY